MFYPQPVALQLTFSEDALSAGTTEEMVRRHRGNDPSETFDVRDYVPGDDVRSIHWKLSGKMDTLIVRQASDPAHYDTVLLPDLGIAHRDSTCPTDAEFNSAVAVTMALCENEPERNRVYLNVSGGSRAYLYAPSSVEIVSGTQTKDVKDTRMVPQGLLGARIYTVTELSSAYPAELTVRASWVASLLEKFLFGGQELQPHELRTIYALLEKVESGGKNNLSARLKRRYSPLVCLRRSFRKEQPA